MRVGIIGAGSMGEAHAAGWAATPAVIGGFLTLTPGSAAELAATYHATVYEDMAALLADVDVVSVCTPTDLHHQQVLEVAAAGKHIVIEKPLSLTVEQGADMIRACQQAGVRLLMAHVLRFFPEYARIRATVDSNTIGQPAVLRLFRRSSLPRKARDNWFIEPERSGGVIQDLMIHDLDFARWIAGDVTQVYARHNGHHALVILTHTSGAISNIEGSWAYPPPVFWTGVEVVGTDGLLQYDSRQAAIVTHLHQSTDDHKPEATLPALPLAESPYITQIKAFYAALTTNTPLPVSAEDGLVAVQIARAALESAHTGQAIAIE